MEEREQERQSESESKRKADRDAGRNVRADLDEVSAGGSWSLCHGLMAPAVHLEPLPLHAIKNGRRHLNISGLSLSRDMALGRTGKSYWRYHIRTTYSVIS
ncbi:hypothetical protein AgCh_040187 [Apium graveolens]